MDLLIPGLAEAQHEDAGKSQANGGSNGEAPTEPIVKIEPQPLVPVTNNAPTVVEGAEAGLLVDLRDELLVKVPSALLMTAEMDDTFGIFNTNVKPRSYSTPNCSQKKQKNKFSSSSSNSAWDSPSFLVNLNDAFVRGSSGSDFSVSANNQTGDIESSINYSQNRSVDAANGNTDEQAANSVEIESRPSRAVLSESDNDNDREVRVANQEFTFISPIVRLEGSSAHEDKTSVEILDNSAESEIFDLNNLSVFAADESDISDYQEMRDSNFQKMKLDFGLDATAKAGAQNEEKLSLIRTPSPSTVLSSDAELKSVLCPSSGPTERDDHSEVVSLLPPALPCGGAVEVQPSTPVTASLPVQEKESPKKFSPFPTLDSIFKKVDDMFSNIDHVDPEWIKKYKARERLASLPAVLQEPEPAATTNKVMANRSLGSGIDECPNSNRAFVASPSADPPAPAPVSKPDETAEEPDNSARTDDCQDNQEQEVPRTPESKHVHEIGTPFRTPASNKFKPTPTAAQTPLSSNSGSTRNGRGIVAIPRLSFGSSSSSSGSDSSKKLSLAKPTVFGVKPVVTKPKPVSLSSRGSGSEFVSALKINPTHKPKSSATLQPLKATLTMTSGTTTLTTAPGPKSRMVCSSAPVTRKFIPPIASSSPKPSKQAPTTGLGSIPSPRRKSLTVKSSGYGQQSLNTSRTSFNTSITSFNTSITSLPPPSPKSKFIPRPISMPSPVKFIPAPRTMPSPIRTRVSNTNSLLPTHEETKPGGGDRRSGSIGDIPPKLLEQPHPTVPAPAKTQVAKNKENKPKGLQRFGFRK